MNKDYEHIRAADYACDDCAAGCARHAEHAIKSHTMADLVYCHPQISWPQLVQECQGQ